MVTQRNSYLGFTLIEVLVALAVLAMVTLASHQILSTAINANQNSKEKVAEIGAMNTVFRMMQQDFTQLALRNTRNESGDSLELFLMADRFLFDSQYHGVAGVRDGWSNPVNLLPRSELQLFSYVVEEDNLVRKYRIYVDSLDGTEPKSQVLLEDIKDFTISFRGDNDKWEENWTNPSLPKAIKVEIALADEIIVSRILLLPENEAT
ncbi:MAG: type II secretion system minor pseudopilin GspJ [Pseudoalteromonas spongiae]|uniref:type II secretion system minor pseudopilin GspJ n=1 Tax=Pseudoalteromonas TaxID=53246 RepID=UPI00026CD861|nr:MULTISPECIES: type II secretion system minor pseudopilin GspJ [Pseudoalteromonas]ATC97524.1 general secretion pathway protein J [Pseudoalteromonas spongiae UST010723-006]MEC8325556.1 type II secretion system minor pseudopilin GspJ [Pseudomonadota bacterium]TMO83958.1 type II secretion system protein GspJ [Pseudoalteromonas spongiae]